MSFGNIESSRSLGQPVSLFFFRYGSATQSRVALTDAEQDIIFDAGDGQGPITYVSAPITRDKIKVNGTFRRESLDITLPRSSVLAPLFQNFPPSRIVTCIVRQRHLNDPASQTLVVWVGNVVSASFQRSTVTLNVDSAVSAAAKPGLRRHWQYGCPHVLYQGECRADKTIATVATTVSAISARNITLPANWFGALPADKFAQGLFEWTSPIGELISRTIWTVRAGATGVLINAPVPGMLVNDPVNLSLGCQHNLDDCTNLHAVPNAFGGCPFIPVTNPVNYASFF